MSEQWTISELTPQTIVTPHGRISISWSSKDYKDDELAAQTARRLCAVWNACKGIETEDLEKGAVGGFVEQAAEMGGIAVRMEARADAAEAALAEAVTAFERIATLSAGGPHVSAKDGMGSALATLDRARDIARAFLAGRETG